MATPIITFTRKLDALYNNINALFHESQATYVPAWPRIADSKQSVTATETYPTLSRSPSLAPWLGYGDRETTGLEFDIRSVTNLPVQASISIPHDHIDDNIVLANAGKLAERWGRSAAEWPDAMFFRDALYSNTLPGPRDQPFFHSSHPLTSARGVTITYSNVMTKQLSAASAAAAMASFGVAYERIQTAKDSEGAPFFGMEDQGKLVLIVHSKNYAAAKVICESPKLLNDDVNPYYGAATPLLNNWAPAGTEDYWFLENIGYVEKPFFWQVRQTPRPIVKNEEYEKIIKMGLDGRAAVGTTYPQLIVRSDGTVA
jgi:hypothetical protein